MKDFLTMDEVCEVTGVEKGSRNHVTRVMEVLKKAGIYFWVKANNEIGTTWYHVHNAKMPAAYPANDDSKAPDFGAMNRG